jgi:hypothetical protein
MLNIDDCVVGTREAHLRCYSPKLQHRIGWNEVIVTAKLDAVTCVINNPEIGITCLIREVSYSAAHITNTKVLSRLDFETPSWDCSGLLTTQGNSTRGCL